MTPKMTPKTQTKRQTFYVLTSIPEEKQTTDVREVAAFQGTAEECCSYANTVGNAYVLDDRGFIVGEFFKDESWTPASAVLGPKMVSRVLIFRYLNGDVKRITQVYDYNVFEDRVTGIHKTKNKNGKIFFKEFVRSLEQVEELVVDRRVVIELFRP